MLVSVAFWTVGVLVSTAIIWWGTSLLETSSEKLSVYYGLPDIVQGAVVVAIGSSFPELSAATLSTVIHGEFDLGVAAIVGSAIFNIMVIPALSSLSMSDPMDVNRALVYKEVQFYIISVAALLVTFTFAVIYFPVPATPGIRDGTMTPMLAILPLILYGIYVFFQYQDAVDFGVEGNVEEISLLKNWLILLLSLAVILVGVELLVKSAIEYGKIFNTPSFLWGMTVVAAATSLPDTVVSVRLARSGSPVTSLANVLGSNIFDLCVCIPAGVLIAGGATINFTVAAPMLGVLIAVSILLLTLMRTNMKLSETESWVFLLLYGIFVFWLVVEFFETVNLVPGIP
jgi:cation:H+ antiporter